MRRGCRSQRTGGRSAVVFANVEFADPNTYSREDDRHDFVSTSYPPLAYGVRQDELSGIVDGILKRPDTDPLVFHTDTETEYYQFRASLYLTNAFGEPIDLPPFPGPAGMCRSSTNPNYHGPTLRALLMALDDWADLGIPPPPSEVPSVSSGTLVTLAQAPAAFPNIPDVQFPPFLNELELLNFGPDFYCDYSRPLDSATGVATMKTPSRSRAAVWPLDSVAPWTSALEGPFSVQWNVPGTSICTENARGRVEKRRRDPSTRLCNVHAMGVPLRSRSRDGLGVLMNGGGPQSCPWGLRSGRAEWG